MNKLFSALTILMLLGLSACDNPSISASTGCGETAATVTSNEDSAAVYSFCIVNTYDHDSNAFTQGLVYYEGVFYEGTGRYGFSNIRKVEIDTGDVLQSRDIADQYFGEGITLWNDQLLQLTWQAQKGFIYDRETFEPQGEFSYPTEGWGITHDGSKLMMSDGSNAIFYLNPDTFEITSGVEVVDKGQQINRLNELEYINGEIWANVWLTNNIVRIDPVSGDVIGWLDLTGLKPTADLNNRDAVLNGIAYDEENDRLFVTGKWWSKLFEIQLVAQN